MKHVIKILAIACIVLLLSIGAFAVPTATATVTGDIVTATPGQTIAYSVSLRENPGIISYGLRLRFDTDVFEIVCQEDDPAAAVCTPGEFTSKGTLVCASKSYGCEVSWTHVNDVFNDGSLFTVWLRVKENAPLGNYSVQIENVAKNTINKNEERVPLVCVDGEIAVRELEPTFYGETISAKQGEELAYCVNIVDNPGIASYDIIVQFDSDVLALVPDGEETETVEQLDNGFGKGSLVFKEYTNAVRVFWSATKDVFDEGTAFVVRFKVLDNAKLGETAVKISCVAENIQNTQEETVPFIVKDGQVTVQTAVEVILERSETQDVVFVKNAGGHLVVVAVYEGPKMVSCHWEEAVSDREFVFPSRENVVYKAMVLNAENYAPVCPAQDVSSTPNG